MPGLVLQLSCSVSFFRYPFFNQICAVKLLFWIGYVRLHFHNYSHVSFVGLLFLELLFLRFDHQKSFTHSKNFSSVDMKYFSAFHHFHTVFHIDQSTIPYAYIHPVYICLRMLCTITIFLVFLSSDWSFCFAHSFVSTPYQFIPLHSCNYLKNISITINVVTDESNSIWTEFSGRGFKSHSGQLSIAISYNTSVVNTICISRFHYTDVITSKIFQLK